MRLWSLRPALLDQKALVAVWREGLLAKAVLDGKTKGYRNHSQLDRFKKHPTPRLAIRLYLMGVLDGARQRGYKFDAFKIDQPPEESVPRIPVTRGQVDYEIRHILAKASARDRNAYNAITELVQADGFLAEQAVAPMFTVIEGGIEAWEKI